MYIYICVYDDHDDDDEMMMMMVTMIVSIHIFVFQRHLFVAWTPFIPGGRQPRQQPRQQPPRATPLLALGARGGNRRARRGSGPPQQWESTKSLATKGGSRSRYIDMTWCHCWFWWYEEDNIIYVNVYSILYWYERDLKMTWNDVSTGEVDAGPTPTRWFPEFLRFFVGSQLASRLDYWIYDDYNYSCLFVYWCLL